MDKLTFTEVVNTKTYARWVSDISYPNEHYIIARYHYDSDKKKWVDPYYRVYFISMLINRNQYSTYDAAVEAAKIHKRKQNE